LIPLISFLLIFLRRKRIFSVVSYCPAVGLPLFILGFTLWYALQNVILALPPLDSLSAIASIVVLAWIAVFILCYGTASFKAAAFPLLFLLLMIPIPTVIIERTVFALQKGSAEVSYGLFRLIGVPVNRHGFLFSLPGIDIEIAEECSGIRSGLSLFITGLLAGHVFLQSTWKKM